ncbi:MAG: hypothetical protein ACK4PR_07530 [Gammaproteobacteria bacterium]
MDKLFDSELLQRIEGDIKQLVEQCQRLTAENRTLREKQQLLMDDYQQLHKRHLRVIQQAQMMVDELTSVGEEQHEHAV